MIFCDSSQPQPPLLAGVFDRLTPIFQVLVSTREPFQSPSDSPPFFSRVVLDYAFPLPSISWWLILRLRFAFVCFSWKVSLWSLFLPGLSHLLIGRTFTPPFQNFPFLTPPRLFQASVTTLALPNCFDALVHNALIEKRLFYEVLSFPSTFTFPPLFFLLAPP